MIDKWGQTRLKNLIEPRLEQLRQSNRWRALRPLPLSPSCTIDLTNNDYLGLRSDPSYQEAIYKAAKAWPAGAGASRLLGGEHQIYGDLEERFAHWKGAEAALYFTSGYAANEALMAALKQDGVVFFSDALNHASLVDGMRMARLDHGQKQIFRHNDLDDLERRLKTTQAALKLIVTESLFSMDGDFCPLPALAGLCQKYEALLVIDEAHSLGIYGPHGAGWIAAAGLSHEHIISINPCGKAMAAAGALIAGPEYLRNFLINTARSFIYSTGPSPWVAAALHAGIPYIQTLDKRREDLLAQSATMRGRLRELKFDLGPCESHIIPLIIGTEAAALEAEEFLQKQGILARAIRPPTVPVGSCRLRLSLNANLKIEDFNKILTALEELRYALS